ncbi:MAG TPA: GPP34 family phosphoprotein [Streptosporangiaceae bacterium]|nr:GPP34 family phosphoprotein [Streptosporangiaceae bacterium]
MTSGPRSVAGLSGTGLLADDLYLVAHHEVSGKPYVQPRALGLGLAGGLLAELVLAGHVGVWRDEVVVAGHVPSEEGLAGRLISLVASEHERHPVRDWLLFLSPTVGTDVAKRLEHAGYLRRAGSRWHRERWAPMDPDWAFAPLLRVWAALDPTRPLTARGAALAGLAAACGLGFRLTECAPSSACRPVHAAVAHLEPGMRELIAHTQAAVDSALLAHRV